MLDYKRKKGMRMPWSMEFTDEGRILKVLIQDPMSSAEAMEMIRGSTALVVEHQALRVLIDCAGTQMRVPTMVIFQLPDLYVSLGMSRDTHIAVIMPRDGFKRDRYEFYEDVCRNRGYFVKLFEQEDEAWKWVREA